MHWMIGKTIVKKFEISIQDEPFWDPEINILYIWWKHGQKRLDILVSCRSVIKSRTVVLFRRIIHSSVVDESLPRTAIFAKFKSPNVLYYISLHSSNKAHRANDASSRWWNDCMMMWLYEIVPDLTFDSLKNVDFYWYSQKWQTNGPVDCLIEMWGCI